MKRFLSWFAWPLLLLICVSMTAVAFASPYPMIGFNATYLFLIISLLVLERYMPHEKQWQNYDGQIFADIAHTLSSKGTVQGILIFGGVIGLTEYITPVTEPGYGVWPREWHMFFQVVLGLVAAEFGLYWAHRLAHEWMFMWRFHAIHHSVTRLWTVNTGRFHFVDSVISIALGISILLILGAPLEVVKWQAAITAFIGLLTHCNVNMRFGPLSWAFNTPGLHRWHHSRNLEEGNKNYSENVMIWDQIFGTFYNPEGRRPPANIGIHEYMPVKFVHQLIWPFLPQKMKDKISVREKGMNEQMSVAAE